jgi:S1-C subfamily serine protease
MKKNLFIFVLASLNLYASDIERVIYGKDNRVDIFESTNPLYKKLATSTAAMIEDSYLSDQGNSVLVLGKTLEDNMNICSDERFVKQTVAASCSGFLIGKQYLITAGHCIQTMADCNKYSWVFDYGNIKEELPVHQIPKTEVYKCTEIVEHVLDNDTDNDYSLVKLNREVTNRSPLKFRKSGSIDFNAKLVVIGHPTGLPSKIADGANVRSVNNPFYFNANLDTFGGNSGSAVFDAKSGIVEGILVRGEEDYMMDYSKYCYRPFTCKDSGCRGEDVTRITNIKALKHF